MQREIYLQHVLVPRNHLQEEHISKLQRPGTREQRPQEAAHTSPPIYTLIQYYIGITLYANPNPHCEPSGIPNVHRHIVISFMVLRYA